MDMLALGQWMGHISARMEHVERELRQLKRDSHRRAPVNLVALMPYVWGIVIIILALAGKMTVPEAMKALGGP